MIEPGDVTIRPMRDVDLDAVMATELAAYEFPWTHGIMTDCLRMGYSAWVLEAGDVLIGHSVVTLAVGELHILNLCVHPHWRGQGLARRLLAHVLDDAHGEGAIRALLEVRVGNLAAQQLYLSQGFSRVGLRKGYYPAADGREDAIVLMREF